ncbi:MAG: hypothetical protein LBL04_13030 [Bacteroidales bacterium]|nr:hypothetical protein [Bacteroidales bacterium]
MRIFLCTVYVLFSAVSLCCAQHQKEVSEAQLKAFNRIKPPLYVETDNGKQGRELKMLVLGNSLAYITGEEGWGRGMASSAVEKDYAHRLLKMTDSIMPDRKITLRISNIAYFERNFPGFDDSFFDELVNFHPDILIIQIGENVVFDEVHTPELFRDAYISLIRRFKKDHCPPVICTTTFWIEPVRHEVIKQVALFTRSFLVELSHLVPLDRENLAKEEKNYRGDKSEWQRLAGGKAEIVEGIGMHPGDKGMSNIAQQIFTVINAFYKNNHSAVLYPAPEGEAVSEDFKVQINGQPLFVYQARVSAIPVNGGVPPFHRPLAQTELSSFGYFDAGETVNVEITSHIDVRDVVIRPLSKNIRPDIRGNKISFQVSEPCQLAIEVNDRHHVLYLFNNPPETDPVAESSEDVLYFGRGVHHPGVIRVKDSQTVYIAGGAVVHGVIVAKNVKNVKIKGRGILDASSFSRDQGNSIQMTDCENIAIEGIILRDAPSFAVTAFGSSNIRVDNIKLIGMWRYNTDGIDVINSHDVSINNTFMRTFDDAIALKGVKGWHVVPGEWGMEWDRPQQGNIYNVYVNNCVVWCDWGRALEIGAETVADSIYHCFFRNSDIIRNNIIAMDIQSGDRAEIFDIHYENIRVEEPILDDLYIENPENLVTDITKIASFGAKRIATSENLGRLFEILLNKSIYSKDSTLGRVHDISYENITYTSGHVPKSFFTGYSDAYDVSNIVFKNVWMNGKKVTGAADANIIITNDFVKGVKFE